MKNNDDPRKLAALRKVQAERKEAAIARVQAEADALKARNAAALRMVGGAK